MIRNALYSLLLLSPMLLNIFTLPQKIRTSNISSLALSRTPRAGVREGSRQYVFLLIGPSIVSQKYLGIVLWATLPLPGISASFKLVAEGLKADDAFSVVTGPVECRLALSRC
jgi:hypothetical protein